MHSFNFSDLPKYSPGFASYSSANSSLHSSVNHIRLFSRAFCFRKSRILHNAVFSAQAPKFVPCWNLCIDLHKANLVSRQRSWAYAASGTMAVRYLVYIGSFCFSSTITSSILEGSVGAFSGVVS